MYAQPVYGQQPYAAPVYNNGAPAYGNVASGYGQNVMQPPVAGGIQPYPTTELNGSLPPSTDAVANAAQ